jgi:hypothetical protein
MKCLQERLRRRSVLIGIIVTVSVSNIPFTNARGGDAEKILKAMSDHLASQKTVSVTCDSDIEVISSHLQKSQFTSSGQVQLSRPDKPRATRTGGYWDVEVAFDGKLITINDKDNRDLVGQSAGQEICSGTTQ